jgi:hypothetical protein
VGWWLLTIDKRERAFTAEETTVRVSEGENEEGVKRRMSGEDEE